MTHQVVLVLLRDTYSQPESIWRVETFARQDRDKVIVEGFFNWLVEEEEILRAIRCKIQPLKFIGLFIRDDVSTHNIEETFRRTIKI